MLPSFQELMPVKLMCRIKTGKKHFKKQVNSSANLDEDAKRFELNCIQG